MTLAIIVGFAKDDKKMTIFFNFIEIIFGNYGVVFFVSSLAFAFKAFLLGLLIREKRNTDTMSRQRLLLGLSLAAGMIENFAWIIKLLHCFMGSVFDYRIVLFFIRIAWGVAPTQYLFLTLFLESLVETNSRFNLRHKIAIAGSFSFLLFFVGSAFWNISAETTSWFDRFFQTMIPFYDTLFLRFFTIFIVIRKLRSKRVPAILQKQGTIFLHWLCIPQWLSDIIQVMPLFPYSSHFYATYITNSYAVTSLSTLLMTCSMYFCMRKMIGLRFLNFSNHVHEKPHLGFIDDFKITLQNLSHVTTFEELHHISQVFFKESFNVPFNKCSLTIRKIESEKSTDRSWSHQSASLAEVFFSTYNTSLLPELQASSIFIYDEIDFSNFYDKTEPRSLILRFLDAINAEIFLPIFEKQTLIGYITVERHARNGQLYSAIERDEMIIFASYLGNIMHLLKNQSLEMLVEQKRELKQELYAKHKEIEQYKESIRSFMHNDIYSKIGVMYYKHRQFIFGNAHAKELIGINLNLLHGHPVSQKIRSVVSQVEAYKSIQYTSIINQAQQTLVICASPDLEKNMIVITVSNQNISDVIKQQAYLLKNPSEWDFLLYLETTRSGRLINQLIPGTGTQLLQFKIDLMKASIHTKALFLDVPEEDLKSTVEVIHHLSLREKLHVIEVHAPTKNSEIALQIFGINPILSSDVQGTKPALLKQLDSVGTLFIKNIHFLDIETQNYLAEFIRYGMFRMFKSDKRVHSDVRIICSSNQSLERLVSEGLFSQKLFEVMQQTRLTMPPLNALSKDELQTLTEGFSTQVIHKDDTFEQLLTLNHHEKNKLISMRPVSLCELKSKVQNTLIKKSKKHEVYTETQFNPAFETTDPDLAQAKYLGKKALKDPKIMATLWYKFKNQSDIATFLGVNRSSVNRRCKEYRLQDDTNTVHLPQG